MKNFAIIRLSSLGDIVITAPVFEKLRKTYPDSNIILITSEQYRGLMDSNPHISSIFYLDPKVKHPGKKGIDDFLHESGLTNLQFDLVIDLHWNFRSHYIRNKLKSKKKFTWKAQSFNRNIYVLFHIPSKIIHVTERYLAPLKNLLQDNNFENTEYRFYADTALAEDILETRPYLKDCRIIFPGSKWFTKIYPKEFLVDLIKRLNLKFIIMGTKDEFEICDYIAEKTGTENLAGEFSLAQTASVISLSKLVITNDSGPMHIASGLGIPLISFFGSTTRKLGFSPNRKNSFIIEDNTLSCRPCSLHGWRECPKIHFKCMMNLKPELTVKRILTWLDENDRK